MFKSDLFPLAGSDATGSFGVAWETRVGSYRKLRLAPERVAASLETIGFETRVEQGKRGMVRVIGRKA